MNSGRLRDCSHSRQLHKQDLNAGKGAYFKQIWTLFKRPDPNIHVVGGCLQPNRVGLPIARVRLQASSYSMGLSRFRLFPLYYQ